MTCIPCLGQAPKQQSPLVKIAAAAGIASLVAGGLLGHHFHGEPLGLFHHAFLGTTLAAGVVTGKTLRGKPDLETGLTALLIGVPLVFIAGGSLAGFHLGRLV